MAASSNNPVTVHLRTASISAKPFDRLRKETVSSAFNILDGVSANIKFTKLLNKAIEGITTWAQRKDTTEGSLMWLDGEAGFGKTRVAREVAARCKDALVLAGAFFFCCSDTKRDNSTKFISTLAYQAAINIPGCRPYIEAAIEADQSIFRQSLHFQLVHLIIEPLTKFVKDHGTTGITYVIIVDALDECRNTRFQASILNAIISVTQTEKLPVRFIITSRPESHIISTFDFDNHPFPGTVHYSLVHSAGRDLAKEASLPPPSPVPDICFANWIWTWETPYSDPPVGHRAFRKTVTIPNGLFVDYLVVDILADDIFALYVNGRLVGSGLQWTVGHRWCITFPRSSKVLLAVCASNHPRFKSAAGLIASCVLWDSTNFTGVTYYTVKTDDSWKSLDTQAPFGFERLSFDDSDWNLARIEGRFSSPPWLASSITMPTSVEPPRTRFTGIPDLPDAPQAPSAVPGSFIDHLSSGVPPNVHPPDLSLAEWIWTHEHPHDNPPVGPRRFRKTVVLPMGKFADSLIVDITCDDIHTLYVNGKVLGYGLHWSHARRWSITFPRTQRLVFAVCASNDPVGRSYAGLLASAVVWDSLNVDAGCHRVNTDESWAYGGSSFWNGFAEPEFEEDDWKKVRVQGRYGVGPWGSIKKPTVISPITEGWKNIAGLPDPPKGPLASIGCKASYTVFL